MDQDGNELFDEGVICSGCGKVNPSSFEFCGSCGTQLTPSTTQEGVVSSEVQSTDKGEWRMLRRDAAYTGSDGSSVPAPLEKVWEFNAGGQIKSSLALAYGMAFFGCTDKKVYALDAANGQLRWEFKTKKEVHTTPIVAYDRVFVACTDKNLYALDVQTGKLQWQFSPGNDIASTPAVDGGLVFFGCKDKHVYAIDAETGQSRWTFKTGKKAHSAPTVFLGIVFISGDNTLFALDATSGELKWSNKYVEAEPCPIVLGDVVFTPRSNLVKMPGYHISDGASKGDLFGQIATIRTDGIFTICNIGFTLGVLPGLYGYDIRISNRPILGAVIEEGTVKKYQEDNMSISAPAMGGDFAYVAVVRGFDLYGFNVSKFMKRWNYRFKTRITTHPVIANGRLFVTTHKGQVHAFKGATDPNATAALEYISGEMAKNPQFKAMMISEQVNWPNFCCLCCGSAEERKTLSFSDDLFFEVRRMELEGVPYCKACHEKVSKIFRGEQEGAMITKFYPPTLRFRNERYWAMFMQANNLR